MKTKDQVLALLKANSNTYISGQDIADRLFLTRAGVWKAIKALRDSGYNIEAVNNRGYCLVTDTEILSHDKIKALTDNQSFPVIVLEETTSTNDEARKLALSGTFADTVIVSDYQTAGRGRRGREFYSPKGTGLYMSFLLHPKMDLSKATSITCMAAVAVCMAIKDVTGTDTSIKWVNDIFINDRKISGILTEGFTSLEDGSLSYVITGIGINLYPPKDGFPPEIRKIAGTLFPDSSNASDVKNRLCAAIINNFYAILNDDSHKYISEYRNRSNLIGHYVKIMQADGKTSEKGYALVRGIDDDCHLLVEYDDQTQDALSTGEVSVEKY